MLRKITKSRAFKAIAVFTAYSMILQIMAPGAYALTSGPTQPEAGTFEQVDMSQMVDLFSGDFKYNLPLLTVPGPNGGYPVNLTYNSNVTMEQEASWVGLGWNLNAGVISREMRGLPDDFKGDEIVKEKYMKPQRTISIATPGMPVDGEIAGFELSKLGDIGLQLYHDNYRGVGHKISMNPTILKAEKTGGIGGNIGITLDSKNGVGVEPNISFSKLVKDRATFHLGAKMHSKQGLKDVSMSAELMGIKEAGGSGRNVTRGTSFANASYVPGIEFPTVGVDLTLKAKGGIVAAMFTADGRLDGSYSVYRQLDNVLNRASYGYLYSDQSSKNTDVLDFNREKDGVVNKHTPALPVPVATNDIFTVKGQGVGGSIRPYRSEVAIYRDPAVRGIITGIGAGAELETGGVEFKLAGNPDISLTSKYSGGWSAFDGAVTDKYGFVASKTDSVYEPVYFKADGELTKSNYTSDVAYSSKPYKVEVSRKFNGSQFVGNTRPYVEEKNGSRQAISSARRVDRDSRDQHISFLTRDELNSMQFVVKDESRDTTLTDYSSTLTVNSETYTIGHHIGQLNVLNSDGSTYSYGLPAYNFSHKDAAFSLKESTSNTLSDKKATYTSGTDDSKNNRHGDDHFYSSTSLPPYAHSFFLTDIKSADYVDLDDTLGVSDGDLGYWVKFNYRKKYDESTVFKWRFPLEENKANLSHGHYSHPRDNKGSYSYGTKEVIYLKSVETKSHVARFYTSGRTDGLGVNGSAGGKNTSLKLCQLDSIKLFNKHDLTYPIKSVYFQYETTAGNQLCQQVPNSSLASGGKLTLTKVWFTHGDNDRGALSPYEFSYHAYNPDYDDLKADRWGQFQPDDPTTSPYYSNLDNPYVMQKSEFNSNNGYRTTERDSIASVWKLTQITLPSSGVINVEYEMDDYAYVQNKRAMQMCRIVDTGEDGQDPSGGLLKKKHKRLYFELEDPIPVSGSPKTELAKYLSGIDKAYFKAYVKLKQEPAGYGQNSTEVSGDGYAYDYVEGYAELDINLDTETGYGFHSNHTFTEESVQYYQYAYVTLKEVEMNDVGTGPKMHPIRKAALQYLKLERQDLFESPNTVMGQVSGFISLKSQMAKMVNLLSDISSIITGWYATATIKGYAKEMHLSGTNFKPSFVRLNSPDYKKYGGGSRVKKLTISDAWSTISGLTDASNYSYGQEYAYTMPDGTSSGVAEYEPLVGGEENPFRQPVEFSSDRFLFKDNSMYVEEPFNESLYPSANVGYRRVVVKNLERTDDNNETVTKSTSGFQVHEFYTAKEYPVNVNKTDVTHKPFRMNVPIPFIGSRNYKSDVYSQGYVIQLNDMHGKPRSETTYAYGSSHMDAPIAKTEYFYKSTKDFNPNDDNELSNTVNVFTADGISASQEIGKTVDVFVDMRENNNRSRAFTMYPNVHQILLATIPVIVPSNQKTVGMFRSVVTNKVIKRCGILEKVKQTKEGSILQTNNLYFDPLNGDVVLSTIQNNFEAPVYSYNYPSHWYYEGTEPAYQNQGITIDDDNAFAAHCKPGDVLLGNTTGERYWVETVSPIKIIKRNNPASTYNSVAQATTGEASMKIIRSGYRNQQGVVVGNITSLNNPINGRYYPLFDNPNYTLGWNNYVPQAHANNGNYTSTPFQYVDCDGDTMDVLEYGFTGIDVAGSDVITMSGVGTATCDITLTFSDGSLTDLLTASNVHIDSIQLAYNLGTITASDGNASASGTIGFSGDCELTECMDGVLNAFADKLKDQWSYDYDDVDAVNKDSVDFNEYRYGKWGVWRKSEHHLYDAMRKQKNPTRTGADGTFEHFSVFNWNNDNPNWTKHNEITQWSPYGFELENQNAIDVKSSALYGYTNSLVTAVANNTPYYEMVFDGFEDYSGAYPTSGHAHGHIKFTGGTKSINSSESHTGGKSLQVNSGSTTSYSITVGSVTTEYFDPQASSRYYISAWVKTDDAAQIKVTADGTVSTFATTTTDQKLDGWRRLEGSFTTGASATSLTIDLKATGSAPAYFDDIRIQPFVSTMKTYVYDPNTYWLLAELDDRNYATFYNYDELGQLVQVKKETEKGIVTIRMNRKNTRDNS